MAGIPSCWYCGRTTWGEETRKDGLCPSCGKRKEDDKGTKGKDVKDKLR